MMTSLKSLLPIAASFLLLLLLLSFTLTGAEVVKSMKRCNQFLLETRPPQIPGILEGGKIQNSGRYKTICQTFRNKKMFVTLYDTENRIPVFSAYKFRGEREKGGKRPPWRTEIQLEQNINNMWDGEYNYQADNRHYKNVRNYNKGHLFPVCHAYDADERNSTFTLTNAVPQAVSFNGGSWQKMENCVKCVMQSYCINNNGAKEGFVVTGARPSNNNKLKNKVNIPSILWSVFCCYSRNMKKWLASAHWGDNVAEHKSKYLQTKTLAELHQELSTVGSRFEVFPRTQCPLHTTVAEYYPDLNAQNKKCQCPPQDATTTAPPTTTTYTTATSATTGTTTTATTTATTTTATTTTTTTTASTTTTTTKKKKKKRKKEKNPNKNNNGSGNPPPPPPPPPPLPPPLPPTGGDEGDGEGGGGGGCDPTTTPPTSKPRTNTTSRTLTTIPPTSEPRTNTTSQTLTTIPPTSEPRTNTTSYTLTTIPPTSKPQTNTTSRTLTTIPPTSEPRTNTTSQTLTTIPPTSEPRTNTTSYTLTTIPPTSETQTNTTSQTWTTIPPTSEPQINTTSQTWTTIPPTSEPQTNTTSQILTTIPPTSKPQNNTTNHTSTTIPPTSEPHINATGQKSATIQTTSEPQTTTNAPLPSSEPYSFTSLLNSLFCSVFFYC